MAGFDDATGAAAPSTVLRDPGVWLLFGVTVVAVGNVSSVAPSFPLLVEALGVSRVEVGWVVTAYALPGILSAPVAGVLADRVGRKQVLVPTLLFFGVAGGACALVRSFPLLLMLRAVQGAAAGQPAGGEQHHQVPLAVLRREARQRQGGGEGHASCTSPHLVPGR